MYRVSMKLYHNLLMEHYHNPRNYGKLDSSLPPTFATQEYNPSCGDLIAMEGIVEQGVLKKLYFTGKGCIISQATASILTQECCDKKLIDLSVITPEALQKMIGVSLGPLRLGCALLPLKALQEGIKDHA